MGNAIECSDEQGISGHWECTCSQAVVESRIQKLKRELVWGGASLVVQLLKNLPAMQEI